MKLLAGLKERAAIARKAPAKAIMYALRRAIPFGISMKDRESYRISTWRYGSLPREPLTKIFPEIVKIEHVDVLKPFDREIGTSVDPIEILIINTIVKYMEPQKILEIGTYDGNTALNLAAQNFPKSRVTTLDLPQNWDGSLAIDIPKGYNNVTERTAIGRQYTGTKYAKNIVQAFGDSAKINWKELGGPFDLIFIDGCHFYDYVKKDTENALRHLSEKGVLIWHDYGMIKDVSKVVDEYIGKLDVHSIRGTRFAVAQRYL